MAASEQSELDAASDTADNVCPHCGDVYDRFTTGTPRGEGRICHPSGESGAYVHEQGFTTEYGDSR